jgi:hypothetical protein
MNDEATKQAEPDRVSPTASVRQTAQPMISRLDNPSNMERSQCRNEFGPHLHFVDNQSKRFIGFLAFDVETVTSRHMNRSAPEGVQGLLFGSLKGDLPR